MILKKILILRKERHCNLIDKNSDILKTLFLYAYNSYWRLILQVAELQFHFSKNDYQNLFALLKDAYKRTFAFERLHLNVFKEVIVV